MTFVLCACMYLSITPLDAARASKQQGCHQRKKRREKATNHETLGQKSPVFGSVVEPAAQFAVDERDAQREVGQPRVELRGLVVVR